MPLAIDISHLSKRYGRVAALSDLALQIDEGEIFGFLGPNGAGKTTTIRLLLGLLKPSSGGASVLGRDIAARDASWRQEIGYLPGELSLWLSFTGEETLDMLARLTGKPPRWRAHLLDRLRLSDVDLRRPVIGYSDGMKQKLGIVQALQCEPRLALLDEPTKGLDPIIQDAFYELVQELPGKGTTVFFSSHVLPEVERVCHRIGMLRQGRLVTLGAVDDLRRAMPRRVTVVFGADVESAPLSALGRVVSASNRRLELHVPSDRIPALVSTLTSLPVADLLIEAPSLEDVFREQYR